MATTGYRFPTANSAISGTWTNPTNAYVSNGSVASVTIAAKNANVNREYGNFGFSTGVLPDGATIDVVRLKVNWRVSTAAGIAFLGVFARVNGSSLATQENSDEPTTLTENIYDITSLRAWTPADFRDGTFFTQLQARSGNNATSVTYEFDYVAVEVEYTTSVTHDSAAAWAAAGTFAATGEVMAPPVGRTLVSTWDVLANLGQVSWFELETELAGVPTTHDAAADWAGVGTFAGTGGLQPPVVGRTLVSAWNVLETLGQVSWFELEAEESELTPGVVGRTLSSQWNINDLAGADMVARWNIEEVGGVTHDSAASWSAAGTFTAAAQRIVQGSAQWAAAATFAGTGQVQGQVAGSASWAASGAFTATPRLTYANQASFAAVATFSAGGQVQGPVEGAAAWAGTATFSGSGQLQGQVTAAAHWTGTATLSTTPRLTYRGTAAYAGAAVWSASGEVVKAGAAAWTGAATFAATGQSIPESELGLGLKIIEARAVFTQTGELRAVFPHETETGVT